LAASSAYVSLRFSGGTKGGEFSELEMRLQLSMTDA
jgi:hypothetical protein